jgi:hypothetical protein
LPLPDLQEDPAARLQAARSFPDDLPVKGGAVRTGDKGLTGLERPDPLRQQKVNVIRDVRRVGNDDVKFSDSRCKEVPLQKFHPPGHTVAVGIPACHIQSPP